MTALRGRACHEDYLVKEIRRCAVERDMNVSTQAIATAGNSVLYKVQRLLWFVHCWSVTTIVSDTPTRRLKTRKSEVKQ